MWLDENVCGSGWAASLLTCLSQTNKLAVVVVMSKAYVSIPFLLVGHPYCHFTSLITHTNIYPNIPWGYSS
jgi:hypothetical protein